MRIEAIFGVPKSYSKKKTKELIDFQKPHLFKPDSDNIIKCVCDALNGLAYKDDSQIYDILVSKNYGEVEKLIVDIEYI